MFDKKFYIFLIFIFSNNFIYLKSKNDYDALGVFVEAFHLIQNNYIGDVNDKKLIESAIKGMFSELDKHSAYLSLKNKDKFKEKIKSQNAEIKSVLIDDESAYVKIYLFTEKTSKELDDFLKSKKSLKYLLLDLRDNPGGLVQSAVDSANLFIKNGPILSIVGKNSKIIENKFANFSNTYSCKIVVLVNGQTASAAEILSAALKSHKRAVIVGSKTYGKGSIQTIIALSDGSALKLTTHEYVIPNKNGMDKINMIGINPDIELNDKKILKIQNKLLRFKDDHQIVKAYRILTKNYEKKT